MNWTKEKKRRVLAFFNNVKSVKEITNKIVDDPDFGSGSQYAYGIRKKVAQKILRKRESLPGGKFSSMTQIDNIRGIGKDTLHDIYFSVSVGLKDVPILLFPVRLETKYAIDEDTNDDILKVRVYPDQINMESHTDDNCDQKHCFRTLPDRFIFVVYYKDANHSPAVFEGNSIPEELPAVCEIAPEDAVFSSGQTIPRFDTHSPVWESSDIRSLDRWPLREKNAIERVSGEATRIVPQEYMGPIGYLGTIEIPLIFQAKLYWTNNFAAAELVGMAARIPLLSKDISRLLVVGIKSKKDASESQKMIKALFLNHNSEAGQGLGVLEYGTPTNNTENAPSGYSRFKGEEEALTPQQVEVRNQLARYLGLSENTFPFVNPETATSSEDGKLDTDNFITEMMQRIVWKVGGYHMLQYMLEPLQISNANLANAEIQATKYVRARGLFPAIRVGNNPYGILPALSLETWQISDLDPIRWCNSSSSFDAQFLHIVKTLLPIWLQAANNRSKVPVVGESDDPDQEMLQFLSMQPGTCDVAAKLVTDDRFIRWLWDKYSLRQFGQSVFNRVYNHTMWKERWLNKWHSALIRTASIIKDLSLDPNIHEGLLHTSEVLRTVDWSLMNFFIDGNMVCDPEKPDDPTWYIGELFDQNTDELANPPETMLYAMMTMALKLTVDKADLREALQALRNKSPDTLKMFLKDALDLSCHRLDAWITSMANRRLKVMRMSRPKGTMIGAYGWVENLSSDHIEHEQRFVHAPSIGQAAAAAVMRSAYLTHETDAEGSNPFKSELTSHRIRKALPIIEGIREGQELGVLLGYQFERSLHDARADDAIDDFRNAFPLKAGKGDIFLDTDETAETVAARNVVDGRNLLKEFKLNQLADKPDLVPLISRDKVLGALTALSDTADAVNDLLMYESIYQSVQGNHERSGAAVDAMAGNGRPPEIESVKTPLRGRNLGNRVCVFLPETTLMGNLTYKAAAEPRIAAWVTELLGPLDTISCTVRVVNTGEEITVRLSDLGIDVLDFLYMAAAYASMETANGEVAGDTELELRIKYFVLESVQQLSSDYQIEINWKRGKVPNLETALSMFEAMQLADMLLDILGRSSALRADVILQDRETSDDDPARASIRPSDHGLMKILEETRDRLKALDDKERTAKWYLEAARCGLDSVVPFTSLSLFQWDLGVHGDKALLKNFLIRECEGDWIDDKTTFTRDEDQDAIFVSSPEGTRSIVLERDATSETIIVQWGTKEITLETIMVFGRTVVCTPEFCAFAGEIDRTLFLKINMLDDLLDQSTTCDHKTFKGAMEKVFGKCFVTIAPLEIDSESDIKSAIQQTGIDGNRSDRVGLWVQQAAQVHPPIAALEDLMMLSDAVHETYLNPDATSLGVFQLPYNVYRFWQALSDEEILETVNTISDEDVKKKYLDRFELDTGRKDEGGVRDNIVSVVYHRPVAGEIACTDRLYGLLLDQWDEVIPFSRAVTGISFNYDQPGAQAPQVVLLGTPSRISEIETPWTTKAVLDIVRDTMDLSRARAVDLDALIRVGKLVPSVFLKTHLGYTYLKTQEGLMGLPGT